jgi:ferritin
MLSQAVLNEMNQQIKDEFFSAYLYLAMSAHFEAQSLPGFAGWMRAQANEEQAHAMKFFDHINDRNSRVVLEGLDKPPVEFGSPQEVFQAALEHEQKITARINKIYSVASQEADYASQVFLQWFISEQVEEEKTASDILDMLKQAGDNRNALLMIDRILGSRAAS